MGGHRRMWWAALLLLASLLAAPARTGLAAQQAIYDDSLAAGWADYSWAAHDLAAAAPVHGGAKSISVTFGGWDGLYLHSAGTATAGFTRVRFWVHGGSAGGQKMNLYAYLGDGSQGPGVAVPAPAAGAWTEVKVSLASLGVAGGTLTGLVWQDSTGGGQPALFIDDVALIDDSSPDGPAYGPAQVTPRAAPADGQTSVVVRAQVSDPQGLADIAGVALDGGPLGRGAVPMRDDGRSNDGAAGDGVFGAVTSVASGTPTGEAPLVVVAQDKAGHTSTLSLGALVVLAAPGGAAPSALPAGPAWGTNAWSETQGQDWQVNSGVPWQYVYQYITYDWYTDGWGGDFVGRFARQAWGKGYVPVVSAYLMLGVPPGCGEGGSCYAQKLQNASAVSAYLAATAEAARQARGAKPVIFHLDPDFTGFMQQLSNTAGRPAGVRPDDPTSYPVALNVPGYPNTLAGFGRRVVDVIHQQAPNALVALQASMWATNQDPNAVTADQAADLARRTAAFLDAMGGAQADLLFVEWSDRDSGSGQRPWWDDTDRQLPRPSRALLWENALSAAAGKRLILWQVPCGNMALDNTPTHYRDNRVAYAFSHPRDLADAGVIAVLFGAGAGDQTQVTTDGGFIAAQGQVAYAAPGAPTGLSAGAPSGPSAPLRWDERGEVDIWGYRLRATRGGQTIAVDVRRASSAQLVLPTAGTWSVTVAAYDAQGRFSPESAPVSVTTAVDAQVALLPLVVR